MSAPTEGGTTREEFRKNWRLVLAAMTGFAFSAIIPASTGVFMEPIAEEFQWSRALVSSAMSITAIITAVLSPFFGVAIDRWGTRRMAIFGTILAGCIISSLYFLNGSATQWVVTWLVFSIAGLMTKSTIWTAAVSSVFTSGRGIAIGLTLSGTAISSAIIPPISYYLIEAYGWHLAYVWLGLGGALLTLAVIIPWLFDGYEESRHKSNDAPASDQTDDGTHLLDAPGLSISEAWRSNALWRIAISTFTMMVITIALNIHQYPILTAAGIDRKSAAFYASVAGIAGIIGKLVTGVLLDRYPGRWVGGITIGLTSLTFILLLIPNATPAIIITAMFINGYAAGTKLQIAAFLTVIYGGMRHFGAIFGAMASLIAAGSGLGPVLGGAVFDIYGTYAPFLIFGIVGTLFSSALLFGLGPYPIWKQAEHQA